MEGVPRFYLTATLVAISAKSTASVFTLTVTGMWQLCYCSISRIIRQTAYEIQLSTIIIHQKSSFAVHCDPINCFIDKKMDVDIILG
jgi:hypothetical protein